MKLTSKLLRWLVFALLLSLLFPSIVLNGWLLLLVMQFFQPLINVFVAATLGAFLLDYPVRQLESSGVKRTTSIFLVLLVSVLLLIVLGVTLVPIIVDQLNTLLERLPKWIESGSQQIESFETWTANRRLPLNLSGITSQLLERLSSQLQAFSGQIIGGVLATVGSVLDLVIAIVLTFYLLLHGKQFWDGLFLHLPNPRAAKVRQSLRQNFHNYFVGQATLAGIMGLAMTTAFLLIQVPFGLLFGLGVGIMALFPFGAALSICLISFLVALNSIWLGIRVLVVATLIDQVIENVVAPRLLGGLTGLNPVWILASLLIGAKVAGFLGLVVAVPLASSIKSLTENLQIAHSAVTTEN